jgi:hypothetical protein
VQFGLSGYADCLEKDILMSAMEMVIERERSVRLGFFAERVQELDWREVWERRLAKPGKNRNSPPAPSKQYKDDATTEAAREVPL